MQPPVMDDVSARISAGAPRATRSLRYRWIRDIAEFQHIAGAWDRALDQSGQWNPFLLSDFLMSWWHYYREGRELRMLLLYDQDRIIGGLPLYWSRQPLLPGVGRVLRRLSYLGDRAANYTEPLMGQLTEPLVPLIERALMELETWDVLHLTDVPGTSRLFAEWQRGGWSGRLGSLRLPDHQNWAIDLRMGQEAYWATMSKKLRRDLRSKRRHAEQRYGPVRLAPVHGAEDVTRLFALFVQYSRESFARRHRVSAHEDRCYSGFFCDFLLALERAHRLDAHALFAGDTVLAVSFGYRYGPGVNWALTAYNGACAYVRPGYLLIEELIAETLRRGQTRYNWYGYDRFYKTQWCNEHTPLVQVFVFNRTLRGQGYAAWKCLEVAARSHPRLLAAVRWIKHVGRPRG